MLGVTRTQSAVLTSCFWFCFLSSEEGYFVCRSVWVFLKHTITREFNRSERQELILVESTLTFDTFRSGAALCCPLRHSSTITWSHSFCCLYNKYSSTGFAWAYELGASMCHNCGSWVCRFLFIFFKYMLIIMICFILSHLFLIILSLVRYFIISIVV